MNNDLDMRPMVEAFKKMAKVNPSLLTGIGWGTIRGLDPIQLEIANGVIPPSSQVERSPFCREWTTKRLEHLHSHDMTHIHRVTTDKGTYDTTNAKVKNGDEYTDLTNRDTEKSIPTFTFWRGLQVGDKVCFIRTNDSQKYIVLWRDNQFDLDPPTQ